MNPSSVILSLITTPFVVGLVIVRAGWSGLVEIGQSSEEIFRGDRLPLLHQTDRENKHN